MVQNEMASPVVANKEGGAVSIVTADSNGAILGDQSWLQSYVKEKSNHALQSRASGVTGKTVTPGKSVLPGKSPMVSAHAQDVSPDRPDFTLPALNETHGQPSAEMCVPQPYVVTLFMLCTTDNQTNFLCPTFPGLPQSPTVFCVVHSSADTQGRGCDLFSRA
jgi:hypothetical protein